MKNQTEIEAVNALKKDDRLAFKYLFEQYYDRLVAYITTYTHNKMQSEDIVQQSFINLWDDRQKLDPNKSPKGYLYTIAYHRYIDNLRKEKNNNRVINEIWQSALSDRIEEDNDLLEKRIEKIRHSINSLPPKCKEILQLNKIQGITYKDIAKQMGISVKTVESQMSIAFKKIRESFEDEKSIFFILYKPLKLFRRYIPNNFN